ncbi:cadherin-like beta sandwich domain-containing protein [Mariniphaga anaerophila]|nr:cadherin-like beta sandwich domain-containing protein [Mariniphaga anaerophila]
MNKKTYLIMLIALVVGIAGCKDFADEITEGSYPRPFSPTNIEANLGNLDDITITWKKVNNAKSYILELYKNDSLSFNSENLAQTVSDILPEDIPVHFKDLEKNVKYSARVKAIKEDGTESKWEGYYFLTKAKEVKITEWNFSEGELVALADVSPFTETLEVNGLKLHAASGKSMRVVSNEVSTGDYDFTHYLDLQGGGTDRIVADGDKNRCVSFEVTEPCIIMVYANGGGAGRTLEAYTAQEVIGTLVVPSSKSEEPQRMMINWTGGKETVYIRSQGSGIYLYLIRVSIGEVYEPSSVSTLTKLSVSEGDLVPSFNSDVMEYTITVPHSTGRVDFSPTLGHAKQTINSELTAELTAEETEHRIEVVAEDGISVSTYIFNIVKEAPSSDATLKNLVITGGGEFDPAFSPDITDYIFTIDTTVTEVTFSGVANHPYATVGGSDATYSNLKLGNNGPFSITVISEDKGSVKNYSVTVRRFTPSEPSANKEWNISQLVADGFLPAGDITEETTVDGLTIFPTVTIDNNNKTVDAFEFNKRLKLNGSGSTTSRALKFNVTGECTITIYALSSSSSSDRILNVDDGTNVIGTINAFGSSSSMETFNYTGGAGSLYLYSPSSGVNIYYVKVVYP